MLHVHHHHHPYHHLSETMFARDRRYGNHPEDLRSEINERMHRIVSEVHLTLDSRSESTKRDKRQEARMGRERERHGTYCEEDCQIEIRSEFSIQSLTTDHRLGQVVSCSSVIGPWPRATQTKSRRPDARQGDWDYLPSDTSEDRWLER
jgi:hypothetical protein